MRHRASANRRAHLAILLAALLFAGGVLGIALDHNPQGAFYGSELGTDWAAIAFLFVTSFLLAFLPLFSTAWLIGLLQSKR